MMGSIRISVATAIFLTLVAQVIAQEQRAPATRPSVARTYTNPVAENLPDPFVIRANGMYYAYGTNAPGEGYRVLESPNLIDWTDKGFAFRKTDTSWGRENFWAPCVVELNTLMVGGCLVFGSSKLPACPSAPPYLPQIASVNANDVELCRTTMTTAASEFPSP